LNVRAKGANGELEAAKWLHKWLNLSSVPARNLEQVRSGGHDLLVPPFVIEVKRCEALAKKSWWAQVIAATMPPLCPVVMFRQNRQPWRFLLPAALLEVDSGYLEVEAEIFLPWAAEFISGRE